MGTKSLFRGSEHTAVGGGRSFLPLHEEGMIEMIGRKRRIQKIRRFKKCTTD